MTTYVSKWTVGALSFITLAVMAFSWFLAAVCDPSWSFGTMKVSLLGCSDVEATKVLFNIGFCIIGGALIVIVGALYLFTKKSRMLHGLFGILIILGGIGLICVGCNPLGEVEKSVHDNFMIATGIIFGILFVLATVEAWIDKRYLGAAVLTSGIVMAALLGVMIPSQIAMFQTALAVYFLVLLLYFSIIWCTKETETVVSLYGREVKS